MLSTGVDIPALEFIVFLRPVKSRILWEQMLGRGTRRCDDIDKSKFVVFDCFDGTLFRYFRDVSNFQIEEPRADPLTIPQIIENIWQNIDRDYHIRRAGEAPAADRQGHERRRPRHSSRDGFPMATWAVSPAS